MTFYYLTQRVQVIDKDGVSRQYYITTEDRPNYKLLMIVENNNLSIYKIPNSQISKSNDISPYTLVHYTSKNLITYINNFIDYHAFKYNEVFDSYTNTYYEQLNNYQVYYKS